MDPKWVFEKDAYQDGNTELMIDYCKRKMIPYQLVDFVLFGHDDHIKWQFGDEECVIVYGTTVMARHVARKKKWYPGVWCNFDELKCSNYLSYLGQFSIQQDYAFLPVAEIYRQWEKLWERYQVDGHVFIRPDDNDKRFNGEKVAGDQKEHWFHYAKFYGAPVTSLAMISRPTHIINAEWRFIVANRKIVTGSLYRAGGKTAMSRVDPDWDFDKGAIEYAERVIASTEWQPAPIYCLDVCMAEANEYRLMEVGSINCCGLYKCDVEKIIDAANELAIVEWNETHSKAF
jgi:hypothetical protein